MVNNLSIIIDFIEDNHHGNIDGQFYYIQLRKRRKDNPDMKKDSVTIQSYYLKDINSIIKRMPEIYTLCNAFNARAMICLNRRSYKKVASEMTLQLVKNTLDEQYESSKYIFNSFCGRTHSEVNKSWIVDVDNGDPDYATIKEVIDNSRPLDICKVMASIPSNTGFHIITKPFDLNRFRDVYPDMDIQKNNPTNLYIP
jgi:hypothetical protein